MCTAERAEVVGERGDQRVHVASDTGDLLVQVFSPPSRRALVRLQ
jgi:hypothetical protein